MPKTIKLPANLRAHAGDQVEVSCEGANVAEVLGHLFENYPDVKSRLVDTQGNLHSYVNVFLGETNIRDADGLQTPLAEDSKLLVVTALAGG